MIDKKVNAEEQIQRMKNLMNYGLTENKQPEYSSVEYSKEAANGKLYGIVREGAKYYIKVAKNPKGNLVSENFDYIGGFRNRKENMFESFASAQRYFVEEMIRINESIDDTRKRVIAESWDLNAKKEVVEEGTKKMQAEIFRQRQIMKNAQNITEGKTCDMKGGCPKVETIETEEPKAQPGAPFTNVLKNSDIKKTQEENIKGKKEPMKGNKKSTNESTETPLVSRKNPDYMDTTHGTEIGNNAPFTNTVEDKIDDAVAEAPGGEAEKEYDVETVNEDVAMHDAQNQNEPTPGVGEKGDNSPFEEKAEITEDVADLDDEIEDDELEDDVDFGDEENETEDGNDGETVDYEVELEEPAEGEGDELPIDTSADTDVNARLDAMEEKLNQIFDAINNMKYDDDELYDDSDDDINNSEDGDEDTDEYKGSLGGNEEEDDVEVVESKSYREMKKRALKEEDDFGKHPAFQKKVMTTPANTMANGNGQYDMNDKSVESEQPYATNKGNQKPYEDDAEEIENAITEAVMNLLKKKLA